jgi:UDP-galactopyranose mutase
MVVQQYSEAGNWLEGCDVVVAGGGIYGLTIAERVANVLGRRVCVLERRRHIGGSCYSEYDCESGIEYHRYGSHLFHTNSEEVWQYLGRFTTFTNYRHRVMSVCRGQVYSMPINLGTICAFFGRYMTPDKAKELIAGQAASAVLSAPANLEEKAISMMGRPLYEAFVRGYTRKQWRVDPRELPPDIITRLPVRFTFEPYYFADRYEGLPTDGYTAMFQKMADSPRIDVRLGVDFLQVRRQLRPDQLVVYSGPIDRYFNYQLGELGWRTLDFEKQVLDVDDFQGAAVVNYADEDIPYTRIHEFKHLHAERRYAPGKTVIYREYSKSASRADQPYYPMNTPRDRRLYAAYRELARRETSVVFGGRLGTYRYLDMDQTVGSALRAFREEVVPLLEAGIRPFPKPLTEKAA